MRHTRLSSFKFNPMTLLVLFLFIYIVYLSISQITEYSFIKTLENRIEQLEEVAGLANSNLPIGNGPSPLEKKIWSALEAKFENQKYWTRDIPDSRPEVCRNKNYDINSLPKASVIVCFYDEKPEVLLRMLKTIHARTPPSLLQEIILIDDGNAEDITSEVFIIPKVKLVQHKKQEGLIRARMAGAKAATGEILVFLDSHCEVNIGWLEPLLQRIKDVPKSSLIPVIQVISDFDFSYRADSDVLQLGGFTFENLDFTWDNLPDKEHLPPPGKEMPFPAMPGGLFAMSKKFFEEVGAYDPGMELWGGENVELSMRVWMCGGIVEASRCSHIGHVFRTSQNRHPSRSYINFEATKRNKIRLSEVWMDEYKQKFYQGAYRVNAEDINKNSDGLEERKQLRKDLNCKDAKWYFENVYPYIQSKDNQELKNKAMDKMLEIQAQVEKKA